MEGASSSSMYYPPGPRPRMVIPKDSLFYAEAIPASVNWPVPVGWRGLRLQDAANIFENTTSIERLAIASAHAQQPMPVRQAPVSAARDALQQISRRSAVSLQKEKGDAELRQRESLKAEGERLGALLSAAPPGFARPGQHMMHRRVPNTRDHFTTRDQKFVKYHRNLLLPLDTPMDMDESIPMVPRAWKLANSASAPSLKVLPGVRRAKTAASAIGGAAAPSSLPVEDERPLATNAPLGMSGLPNSVPLRKVFQYSPKKAR